MTFNWGEGAAAVMGWQQSVARVAAVLATRGLCGRQGLLPSWVAEVPGHVVTHGGRMEAWKRRHHLWLPLTIYIKERFNLFGGGNVALGMDFLNIFKFDIKLSRTKIMKKF